MTDNRESPQGKDPEPSHDQADRHEEESGQPAAIPKPDDKPEPKIQSDRIITVRQDFHSVMVWLLLLVAVVIGLLALKHTYVVTMPLAVAFFLAMLVHPLYRWLSEHLPRWLYGFNVLLTMAVVIIIIAGGAYLLWLSGAQVAETAPEYKDEIARLWDDTVNWGQRHGLHFQRVDLAEEGVISRILSTATKVLYSAWQFIGLGALCMFYLLLILIETEQWRHKGEQALRRRHEKTIADTLTDISARMQRYFLVHTIVSAVSAGTAALWLWILGVDLIFVWALIIFFMSYIPNIGAVISTILPSIMALVQHGFWWALLVAGGLTALEMLIGNYITPIVEGRAMSVSPIVILFSVILWGWIWGIAGAFLGAPIAVAFTLVCLHIDTLKPLGVLLSRDSHDGDAYSNTS